MDAHFRSIDFLNTNTCTQQGLYIALREDMT
jgi:hypothetical protein